MDQILLVDPKPKKDWKDQFTDAQDKFVSTLNSKFEKVDKQVEESNWMESLSQKQDKFVSGMNSRFY